MTGGSALVLAAHGSHHSHRSAEPVYTHGDRIRDRGLFTEVREAFWKEEPSLRGVWRTIESDEAFVVPVMTSEGYFVDEVFPRELRSADPDPDVHYTEPIGTHPAMTDVIIRRARTAIGDADRSDIGLAVVGHGTDRNQHSADATLAHANRIRARGLFAEVHAAFLDEPPLVAEVPARFETDEVVVVPVFVADGSHTTVDVPSAIGISGPCTEEPEVIEGCLVGYTGAVGTETLLTDVIVERTHEAGAAVYPAESAGATTEELRWKSGSVEGDRLRDWNARSRAAKDFLRWIDGTDGSPGRGPTELPPEGLTRRWGQLAITVTPTGDGRRHYDVRHMDDRDEAAGDLERLSEPAAIRDHVRKDDDGRFRPLRGAPTLPIGWVAPDLDAGELVGGVEAVYPGSVAAWHREQTDALEVTHFRETAARQSGIYKSISDLRGGDLACAVEACCADCVKRRAWDEREGEPIDAERGDGVFPCPEPCSFFVAASREFLRIEDADAGVTEPDPTVPAGAVDRPGNRFRARYLQAKRGKDRGKIQRASQPRSGGSR